MELKDRSTKAQEKHADQLMTISTGIFSATFLGVLVVPLSAFIASLLGTSQTMLRVSGIFTRITWIDVFKFAILYFVPLGVAGYARKRALGIYDRISK
ncbi:hypothetical protein [Geobacter argillaceus]|uniref:hypothetical protein n=1 Tax=Geobacter argillaceus TaxID=345631 RepID=UPI0011A00868|nr:hypothetical protein [Geobacter argillaceus]